MAHFHFHQQSYGTLMNIHYDNSYSLFPNLNNCNSTFDHTLTIFLSKTVYRTFHVNYLYMQFVYTVNIIKPKLAYI